MTQEDALAERANRLVKSFILRQFSEDCASERHPGIQHLLVCPSTFVQETDGHDGIAGCDTGCEYYRLTSTLSCEHRVVVEYEYGEYGSMSYLVDKLIAEEGCSDDAPGGAASTG